MIYNTFQFRTDTSQGSLVSRGAKSKLEKIGKEIKFKVHDSHSELLRNRN